MKMFSVPVLTLLLLLTLPGMSLAANEPNKAVATTAAPLEAAEVNTLMLRLDEINAMDKSDLSTSEKKALRKEVKSIRDRLATGGVYVSVGAIIIIALLLIFFL